MTCVVAMCSTHGPSPCEAGAGGSKPARTVVGPGPCEPVCHGGQRPPLPPGPLWGVPMGAPQRAACCVPTTHLHSHPAGSPRGAPFPPWLLGPAVQMMPGPGCILLHCPPASAAHQPCGLPPTSVLANEASGQAPALRVEVLLRSVPSRWGRVGHRTRTSLLLQFPRPRGGACEVETVLSENADVGSLAPSGLWSSRGVSPLRQEQRGRMRGRLLRGPSPFAPWTALREPRKHSTPRAGVRELTVATGRRQDSVTWSTVPTQRRLRPVGAALREPGPAASARGGDCGRNTYRCACFSASSLVFSYSYKGKKQM